MGKKTIVYIALSISLFFTFSFIGTIHAQQPRQWKSTHINNTLIAAATKNDFGLSKTKGVKLPDQSPAVFIGTIIRWIMGILGVALVAMFVYGGVLYATAAGNDDRVGTAKKVITYAVIGTVIVVAAALISEFVLNALLSPATVTPVI